MRGLEHDNIIKLIDFSESRQYYYIILELAPGGELFHQIVRLTYFSENLSRHVITQVAEALQYLHEVKGVVHRYVIFPMLPLAALTDVILVISSLRTCSLSQSHSSQRGTQNQNQLMTKIRLMRENSSEVSELVELVG